MKKTEKQTAMYKICINTFVFNKKTILKPLNYSKFPLLLGRTISPLFSLLKHQGE